MYCMRAELRHMDKTCPGSIVCVSSVQGTFGFAGHAAYSASKHGVLGLVKSEYMYLDKDEKNQNPSVSTSFVLTRLLMHGDVPVFS